MIIQLVLPYKSSSSARFALFCCSNDAFITISNKRRVLSMLDYTYLDATSFLEFFARAAARLRPVEDPFLNSQAIGIWTQ